jgi:hypothetical protein
VDLESAPRAARITEVVGPPELGEHLEPAFVLQDSEQLDERAGGTKSRRLSRNLAVPKTPSPKARARVLKVAACGSAAGLVVAVLIPVL